MTKRITISVSDEVAAHLSTLGERKVSAYVTEVVKQDMDRQRARAALEELFEVSGHRPDDDALNRARAMVAAGQGWQRRRQQAAA